MAKVESQQMKPKFVIDKYQNTYGNNTTINQYSLHDDRRPEQKLCSEFILKRLQFNVPRITTLTTESTKYLNVHTINVKSGVLQ